MPGFNLRGVPAVPKMCRGFNFQLNSRGFSQVLPEYLSREPISCLFIMAWKNEKKKKKKKKKKKPNQTKQQQKQTKKKKQQQQQQQKKKKKNSPTTHHKNTVLCLQIFPLPTPAPHPIFFHLEKLSTVVFWCARIYVQFYLMPKAPW